MRGAPEPAPVRRPRRRIRCLGVAAVLLTAGCSWTAPAPAPAATSPAAPWSGPRTVGPVVPDGEGGFLTAAAGPNGSVLLRRYDVDGPDTTALLPLAADVAVFRGGLRLERDGRAVRVDYGDGAPTVALTAGDRTIAVADSGFGADAPPLSYGVVGPPGGPAPVVATRIAGLWQRPTVHAAGAHVALSAVRLDPEGPEGRVWLARGTPGTGVPRLGAARPVTPRAQIDDHVTAVGPRGDVLVAWTVEHGAGDDEVDDVLARTVSPHGRLSAVRRLGRVRGDVDLASAAVDADGRSAVAWSGPAPGTESENLRPSTFWIAQGRGGRPPASGRPYVRGRTSRTTSDGARSGELAFAGPGPPLVALLRGGTDAASAEVGTADTARSLRRLSPRGVSVDALHLSAAPDGTAAVAFSGNPDVPLEYGAVWAARRPAGTRTFGVADRLARGSGGGPAVAVTPDGRRTVVAWIGSRGARTTYVVADGR